MYQEACKIALRFSQGMPKRIPDMEGLVDGRVQGCLLYTSDAADE